jgi:hypothetical protein
MNGPLPQNGLLSDAAAKDVALERRIDAAMERKLEPQIRGDFAATVAARAAMLPQKRRARALPIGRSIAWISAAVLMVALFAFAPHATPNIMNARFDAEIVALCELAGLGWILARGPGARRVR